MSHQTFAPEFIPTPFRPFLLEAFYKWFIENSLPPLLLVDCSQSVPGLKIPACALDKSDRLAKVVFDIAPDAVDDLTFGTFITMVGYFDDGTHEIQIPTSCVLALFNETYPEAGLFFNEHNDPEGAAAEIEELRKVELTTIQAQSAQQKGSPSKDNHLSRSKLKIVSAKKTDAEN